MFWETFLRTFPDICLYVLAQKKIIGLILAQCSLKFAFRVKEIKIIDHNQPLRHIGAAINLRTTDFIEITCQMSRSESLASNKNTVYIYPLSAAAT